MQHKINIKIVGQNGIPLVFFHGWGFNHTIWSSFAAHLAPHYSLYLVDLPGFGQTDLMDWDIFKTQLLTQLPAQFAVVGWSLGGLYAIRLAVEAPHRVSQLIGIAASPFCIETPDWPGIEKSNFEEFLTKLLLDPQQTTQRFLQLQSNDNILIAQSASISNLLGLEYGLEVLLNWDLREALHQFSHPACFVFGRLDAIIPAKTMTTMQRQYPQFQYHLLKRAAHVPFLSHTDQCVQIIQEFLA